MKPTKQQSNLVHTERHQHFSGPIPDPSTLARYNDVVAGAAERILKMAEDEARSRRENETAARKHLVVTSYLGITFAFLSVIIISTLVFFALLRGFDTVAATIAVGSIASVAGVFVFFRSRKNNN